MEVKQYTRFIFFIPGTMLILAIFRHPYIYYQVLRWIVFLSCGYFLQNLRTLPPIDMCLFQMKHRDKLLIILAIIAIIFNPIAPFHLTRSIWAILNVIAGIFMLFYGLTHFINAR